MEITVPQNESVRYRLEYLSGIRDLIAKKQAASHENRDNTAKAILADKESSRKRFCAMLGWPLTEPRPAHVPLITEDIPGAPSYEITRMQYEVFPGLPFYGILFRHRTDAEKKRPLIIAQHGGHGTPEVCSGLFGDTYNYNGMVDRVLALGANVFVPQMLLWREGDYGLPDNERNALDIALKQLGGSITALELYCLSTALDHLVTLPYVDADDISMIGLSYGGFYTHFFAAVDTRVKRAVSCAQFSERTVYNWQDWTWFDAANTFGDAEIAMLIHPRRFTVLVGDRDPLFDVRAAEREYARLCEQTKQWNENWLSFHVFDGEHELCRDDEILKKALL